MGVKCSVDGCENQDIEWNHVDKLSRMKDVFGKILVVTKKERRVNGIESFKVALNRKQIPLCKLHYTYLHNKKLSFSGLNWDYIKEVS
jgi:hypothetical protein